MLKKSCKFSPSANTCFTLGELSCGHLSLKMYTDVSGVDILMLTISKMFSFKQVWPHLEN